MLERETICHPNIHEILVFNSKSDTAKAFADEAIISEVNNYPSLSITNATGNTMLPVDAELKVTVDQGKADFSKTKAHHLDEYHPYPTTGEFSFVKFLYQNVFDPLHIKKENIFTLNGTATDAHKEAERYEELLQKHKIGLAILGVGPGGHIGFNEATNDLNSFNSRTHLQILSDETYHRDVMERNQDTPKTALTQGIATILEADRIVLVAYGSDKGKILNTALNGEVSPTCPASALRLVGHKVSIYIDKEAANEIKLGLLV